MGAKVFLDKQTVKAGYQWSLRYHAIIMLDKWGHDGTRTLIYICTHLFPLTMCNTIRNSKLGQTVERLHNRHKTVLCKLHTHLQVSKWRTKCRTEDHWYRCEKVTGLKLILEEHQLMVVKEELEPLTALNCERSVKKYLFQLSTLSWC